MSIKINNYFKYNDLLASGAQPSAEDLKALKSEGFEAIVNISPASTRNALKDEAAVVENLEMDYVHFPVDCSNLRPLHYATFRGIMNGMEGKKTFVHCGGNIKSSNLLHIYQVLEKGVPETDSIQTLRKIQSPESKWFTYFKSVGMNGIEN